MSKVTASFNFEFGTRKEIEKGASDGLELALKLLNRINKNNHNYKDRTGNLTASHGYKVTGLTGSLFNTASYSAFVHDGTKRHWIQPVKAKALSWVQGGVRRFSKGHYVSGITARLWMKNNLDANFDRAEFIIERGLVNSIIKGK